MSVTVNPGEVHALAGANGSGKSTLIKILAGYHDPSDDSVLRADDVQVPWGAGSCRDIGVRFVHQDLGLVPSLNTVENLGLATYARPSLRPIRWRTLEQDATEAISALGFDFDVTVPVDQLSLVERTGVALARAIHGDDGGLRTLVLDEPTAALPAREAARLWEAVRRLTSRGIGVLLVTHHLEEVLDIGDRVSVLRNGHLVQQRSCEGLTQADLAEMIVGSALVRNAAEQRARVHEAKVLELTGFSAGALDKLDLTVHGGEVVGVAGLLGSGRESIAAALSGQLPSDGTVAFGAVEWDCDDLVKVPRSQMAFVPGDRATLGLIPTMNVRENLTLGNLGSHFQGGYLRRSSEREETRSWMDDFSVVASSTEAEITSLSGGNQQKVLVARALRNKPSVLVLDDPTAGVDIGGKEEIHQVVENAAGLGMGVLLISTDSDELARMSDRVLILSRGKCIQVLHREKGELDAASINHAQLRA